MEIRMARGDIVTRSFTIKQHDKTIYEDLPDEIYMTVKKRAEDREYKFQKKLTEGAIVNIEPGRYQFTIEPDDTNGLAFGNYDFDIEIVKNPSLKKTFNGTLILEKEVTHAYNEGG